MTLKYPGSFFNSQDALREKVINPLKVKIEEPILKLGSWANLETAAQVINKLKKEIDGIIKNKKIQAAPEIDQQKEEEKHTSLTG
jgi:hypothetical protein